MPVGKYTLLLNYLEALPLDQSSVTLTFAELESLIGPLPAMALVPWYWASSAVARHNWRRLGFRARLDRLERSVMFTAALPAPRTFRMEYPRQAFTR